VRGLFRMTCLMIGSAGMTNVRRIQRHLIASHPSNQSGNPFSPFINRLWESWIHFIRLSKPYFAC
jgi:acyl-homoserine lactone acylase PvdQ